MIIKGQGLCMDTLPKRQFLHMCFFQWLKGGSVWGPSFLDPKQGILATLTFHKPFFFGNPFIEERGTGLKKKRWTSEMLCNKETRGFDFMACAAQRRVLFGGDRPSKMVTKWSQGLKDEGQKNRKKSSLHEEAGSVLWQGGVGPTSNTERRTWALVLRRTLFTGLPWG